VSAPGRAGIGISFWRGRAGGAPILEGGTKSEKRHDFVARFDWIRTGLMFEPRGHEMMSGGFLYPPTSADADIDILFAETSGCLPTCGHGTIGIASRHFWV
jgi:4-hydroxyproline epimerase